jgi:hypothetical protein
MLLSKVAESTFWWGYGDSLLDSSDHDNDQWAGRVR